MSYQVMYAKKPLHDYMNIYGIERTILPERENSAVKVNGMNGEYYTNYRYGVKKITLKCGFVAENKEHFREIIKEIAFLLDVEEPQEMIMSDEPDKFVYAVVDGETNLERKFNSATFDLNFICYNPYEYSVELKNTLPEEDEAEDLPMSNKHILNIENDGSASVYPIVKASFYGDAHFFQCMNNNNQAVLVGVPPSLDIPTPPKNPVVLDDDCTLLEGWNNVGNILDGDVNRVVDGSLTINNGGYAITCYNYGSSGDGIVWHGAAGRKNLLRPVTDFELEVDVEHSSGGTLNSISNGSSGSSGNYIITAKVSANVRSIRSTKGKIVTTIPRNTRLNVTDIKSKWGAVNYKGKKGYISMSLVKKVSSSSSSGSKYKTSARINQRTNRGTKYKVVQVIPKSVTLTVTSIKNDWGYVTYNGKKGYVYMKNLKKVNTSKADGVSDAETKEDRMGRCEIYLFDKNGQKLAKFLMRDSSSYYHYSEPEMYIGSKLLVSDNKSTPKAKTTKKTEDGKTVTKKIDSGNYGSWNEFDGKFTIKRTTKNGKQYWDLKVVKYGKNGTIENKIEKTGLCDNSYPQGDLANIVIWFGAYKDIIPVDVQNISNIKVTELNSSLNVPKKNVPIFKDGDELLIDFESQEVLLNRENFLHQLDIGSDFFEISAGQEEIMCISDTDKMVTFAEYRDRWL